MNTAFARLVLSMILVAVAIGCERAEAPRSEHPEPTPPTVDEPAVDQSPVEPASGKRVAPGIGEAILPERDFWSITMLGGQRIGDARVSVEHVERDGRPMMRVGGEMHLAIQRFGQTTEQELRYSCLETPEGRLREFQSSVSQGDQPMRTVGRVDGDRLRMTIDTAGRTQEQTIPWSAEFGGFHAVDQSLMRRPMKPGERRTVRGLELGLHAVATHELAAERWEEVELPSGRFELLRIAHVTTLGPGTRLEGVIWTDARGEMLKTWIAAGGLESYRVSRELAQADVAPADLDLGWDVAVKLDRPLPRPHRNRRATYRVTLSDGDPAEVFPTCPSQSVRPIDEHTAELTVWSVRPELSGNPDAPSIDADAPTDADRRPSSMIQSDDARILELAQQATAGAKTAWQKAVAAERFVHEYLTEKGFSQAFATAAEVAQSREGDCSEHSVLLIALLRAVGIPARAAAGLVYSDDGQAFYYHMWVEAYVDGRWVPLDATLGLGGIGAGHLKLAESNLDTAAAFTAFLPVVRVLGKLKVELLAVEAE